MNLFYIAFTERGKKLADSLAEKLGGEAVRCGRSLGLAEWTAAHFQTGNGLIFVGAVGIAVRAIAPYVDSKSTDPAVVAVDEGGRFAIPLLSGHLGGANDLARTISKACGALPVITTATDLGGIFAVDQWARYQNCAVLDADKIKTVSGRLLAGDGIKLYSPWPIIGHPPAGVCLSEETTCDVQLEVRAGTASPLRLVPRIAVLGVGCKRGTPQEAIEEAFAVMLERSGLHKEAIQAVATIDLKKDEPGLLAFCQTHGWPLHTYSVEQLRTVNGDFTPSTFVESVTGVDNVCERAAVLASGGELVWKKTAAGGVTMAVALAPFQLDWRWQSE